MSLTTKLGHYTQPTNVGAQKIDGSALKTYDMNIAGLSIKDELGKIRFFDKNFLIADTSMDVVLGMLFLSLNNADVQFDMRNLI